MKTLRAALIAAIALVVLVPAGASAATITGQTNAVTLGNEFLNPGDLGLLNNSSAETKFFEQPTSALTAGDFAAPFLGFPTGADNKTIVLATNNVVNIPNASPDYFLSEAFTDPVDNHGSFANDVTTLQLAVTVPAGKNCVSFDYRFLSEEYPKFVGTEYNDAFIAGIDFNDWNNDAPFSIYRPHDIAADPAGKPVSVNGVGPTAMLATEAAGTAYNAATGLVTTKAPITQGPHKLFFSIFDASDRAYDSAVFLDNLHFIDEDASTCKPPLAQQLAPPAIEPPSNVFTVTTGSSITFGKGTASIKVTVPAPGTLTASDAGAATASAASARATIAKKKSKKKKKYVPLIKPATVVATAAGPVVLNIKPTKAGLKILNKTGKLKVKVAITFTPTGGTAASQVKSITIKKAKKKKKKKK